MRVFKFCGRERLLGGERRWFRLARAADFNGRLEVYGYGVSGRPGGEQRRAYFKDHPAKATVADFAPGVIRVWVPCACASIDDEYDASPIESFAHELGHHRQYIRGSERWTSHAEAAAERYGRMLLSSVS